MFRVVAEDTDIEGVPMRAGDRVALVYPSANRDERMFADPETLDLGRDPDPHVSFGLGTHFCLGPMSPAWCSGWCWSGSLPASPTSPPRPHPATSPTSSSKPSSTSSSASPLR